MRFFATRRRPQNLVPEPMRYHSIVTWELGHVRAAVLDLKNGSAEMVGVATAPVNGISRTAHPDVDRWTTGIERALSQSEDMTPNTCHTRVVPDYVTMCLPSEITRGITIKVSQDRRRASERISLEELTALLQRGFRMAQDQVDTRSADTSYDLIHGAIGRITIDGERVIDPVGLHSSQITLELGFTLAPMEWIRALEVIAERSDLRVVNVVPHHTAYGSAIAESDALLILVDEQHTTVATVNHGRAVGAAIVEMGEQQITAEIAATLKLQGRQAGALLRAFRSSQLRDDIEFQIARVFWAQLRACMDGLAGKTREICPDATVPHHIIVADLTRRIPEIAQALETPYWEASLPFAACPIISQLGISNIAHVLDCTGQASGPGYLLLRSLAHWTATLYSPMGVLDRTLAEMVCWRSPSSATIKQR